MKNIEATVSGSILTLTVDLSKEYGLSSTGKTIIVASSEGNQNVPEYAGLKFGLNVYKK